MSVYHYLYDIVCEPHDSVMVRSVHSYIPAQAAVAVIPHYEIICL